MNYRRAFRQNYRGTFDWKETTMPSITNTVTIAAAPEDVWAVLSDMSATRMWLPGVVSARMDDGVRICVMADGQEVHEEISELSNGDRSFRFRHVRVPLPIAQSGGTFTVASDDEPGTATVVLRTTFEPLDPSAADELVPMIRGAFQQSLESLRRYLEQKRPWDAGGS
jgi:uncharacterized protein YndB with AHSA1/START domain